MKTNVKSTTGIIRPKKKAYQTPKLRELGSVRALTLKTGSATDGFGGSFG